jgi:hypothetical protein
MKVLIAPDGQFFFAQGVEMDYAAQGNTVDEAKANFAAGLEATKKLHLDHFGEVRIDPAPEDVIADLRATEGLVEVEL